MLLPSRTTIQALWHESYLISSIISREICLVKHFFRIFTTILGALSEILRKTENNMSDMVAIQSII
ncbi:hypothetical protein AGMMS49975_06270 [Clostridia bacterium]|nr:hypothetical protein AGMMS49975_06270 [Clostridia bacterium]